jgi:hypothetical protein
MTPDRGNFGSVQNLGANSASANTEYSKTHGNNIARNIALGEQKVLAAAEEKALHEWDGEEERRRHRSKVEFLYEELDELTGEGLSFEEAMDVAIEKCKGWKHECRHERCH